MIGREVPQTDSRTAAKSLDRASFFGALLVVAAEVAKWACTRCQATAKLAPAWFRTSSVGKQNACYCFTNRRMFILATQPP